MKRLHRGWVCLSGDALPRGTYFWQGHDHHGWWKCSLRQDAGAAHAPLSENMTATDGRNACERHDAGIVHVFTTQDKLEYEINFYST